MGDERIDAVQLAVESKTQRSVQRQIETLGEVLRLEILKQARKQETKYFK